MLYVAISRARQRSFVNFCDLDCQLQEGFIYIIVNTLTNKLYIGSTKTSIEQRYQEHILLLMGRRYIQLYKNSDIKILKLN